MLLAGSKQDPSLFSEHVREEDKEEEEEQPERARRGSVPEPHFSSFTQQITNLPVDRGSPLLPNYFIGFL